MHEDISQYPYIENHGYTIIHDLNGKMIELPVNIDDDVEVWKYIMSVIKDCTYIQVTEYTIIKYKYKRVDIIETIIYYEKQVDTIYN